MWFDVTLDGSGSVAVEGTRTAKLFGKDASEVAKAYGMFLKNYEPIKIEVNWTAGKACFNTWYTIETLEIGQKGTKIIVECYFAKKVCLNFYSLCVKTSIHFLSIIYMCIIIINSRKSF